MAGTKQPGVVYRHAVEADLPAAADLFLAARDEMLARVGTPHPTPPRASVVAAYQHVARTGSFQVAEAAGRIEGIAAAVVRDRVWFLSAFWVRPGLQGTGIGGPLLDRTWEDGKRAGAQVFSTWSSPDLTAQALYMRTGMLPACGLFSFGGEVRKVPAEPVGYELRTLTLPEAASIDGVVRGAEREVDHHLWRGLPGTVVRGVHREGRLVGYFYAQGASVGPAGWTEASDGPAVLALALRQAAAAGAAAAAGVRLHVPGTNHAAIRQGLEAGLRLHGVSQILTTTPFGQLDRYIPSGPSLF